MKLFACVGTLPSVCFEVVCMCRCAQDRTTRGIVKISYDLGYATHTKSLLVGSETTVEDIVGQIHEQLRLTGSPQDYVIEERNHMTQG